MANLHSYPVTGPCSATIENGRTPACTIAERMPVPAYNQFIEPLLRYLAQHPEGVEAANAHDAVADALKLSEGDRAERVPSGAQQIYKNRNGWAHDRLKRAGLSASPKFGFWQLTKAGFDFVKSHARALTEDEIVRLTTVERRAPKLSAKNGEAPVAGMEAPAIAVLSQSPEERIDTALGELRESVARDLLELVGRAPPAFFEGLVLDLLHAMGYGTSRDDLQQVGGSGDGGIDGIISLDRLGLEKVYVQAKRWKNVVGRPEIQGFYGALAGKRANKGVFITTSAFTKEASEFAMQVEKIVLVDGRRLSTLMIEHGVGVSHKAVKVPKVDSDYFEGA